MERSKSIWRPIAKIIAIDIIVSGALILFFNGNRQFQMISLSSAQVLALLTMLSWVRFFSDLPGRLRRLIPLSVVGIVILFFALFKIEDLSGDLVPQLSWRWSNGPVLNTRLSIASSDDQDFRSTPIHKNYSQFLGPNRNAVLSDVRLERNWTDHPPKRLWTRPVGAGWSSFAIADGRAITQEQIEDEETVTAYQLIDGGQLWRHKLKARFEHPLAGVGPRATPTINDNYVYSFGATGTLLCLKIEDGSEIWRRNTLVENKAILADFGMTSSPLIIDSLVVVCVGGPDGKSLVAYHKETGKRVWSGGSDMAGYSSPFSANILGKSQVVIFSRFQVSGHDPVNGTLLWKFPWPEGTQQVAQPIVFPDATILVSSGYGIGSKLFQVETTSNLYGTKLLWESKRLKSKFSTPVHRNGFIYGLDDGVLACMNMHNGKREWKRGRYGHGQILLVDDLLVITSEKGEIALVEAKPDAYTELARMPGIEGKTWNTPALAAPYLLIRNASQAAAYELTLADESWSNGAMSRSGQ